MELVKLFLGFLSSQFILSCENFTSFGVVTKSHG